MQIKDYQSRTQRVETQRIEAPVTKVNVTSLTGPRDPMTRSKLDALARVEACKQELELAHARILGKFRCFIEYDPQTQTLAVKANEFPKG